MKVLLSLLLLLGSSLIAWAQGLSPSPTPTSHELLVGGYTRTFIVHVPASYTGSTPLPVVFMYHGSSGDGERFYRISGWREKADAEGFIAVFPDGLRYCVEEDGRTKHITKWNDGKLETYVCPGQALPDDVQFFREMVAYLDSSFSIDRQRVYVSGFSNGANFGARLAVEAGDLIAAVAIVAGTLVLPQPVMVRPLPVFQVAGAADPGLLDLRGGLPMPLAPDSIRTDSFFAPIIEQWLDLLGLTDAMRARQAPWHGAIGFHGPGVRYIFAVVEGLEHKYPNGANNPAGYIAANRFWEFFSRHRLP